MTCISVSYLHGLDSIKGLCWGRHLLPLNSVANGKLDQRLAINSREEQLIDHLHLTIRGDANGGHHVREDL